MVLLNLIVINTNKMLHIKDSLVLKIINLTILVYS